jgi:hypothetical protein
MTLDPTVSDPPVAGLGDAGAGPPDEVEALELAL